MGHTLVFSSRKNGYPTGYPLALPTGALNRYLQINQRRSDYFNRLYLIVEGEVQERRIPEADIVDVVVAEARKLAASRAGGEEG